MAAMEALWGITHRGDGAGDVSDHHRSPAGAVRRHCAEPVRDAVSLIQARPGIDRKTTVRGMILAATSQELAPVDTWAHLTDVAVAAAAFLALVSIIVSVVLARNAASAARKDRRYTFELGLLAQLSRDIGARNWAACHGPIRALIRDANDDSELLATRGSFEVQNTPLCDSTWRDVKDEIDAKFQGVRDSLRLDQVIVAQNEVMQLEIATAIETRVGLDK